MATESITIALDEEAAAVFRHGARQARIALQSLVSALLKPGRSGDSSALARIMDRAGEQPRERG